MTIKESFQKYINGYYITNNIEENVRHIFVLNEHEKTLIHTLKVVEKCNELSDIFGADYKKVEIAALLHDISGVMQKNEFIEFANIARISIYNEEKDMVGLLHQRISRLIAEEVFNISDNITLGCIECHTTLKSEPCLEEMILFIADKIESFQGCDMPYNDRVKYYINKKLLKEACLEYILYVKENSGVLHPWLRQAIQYLQ